MLAEEIVSIVDDDADLRASLAWVLRSVGLRVQEFGSAAEFLANCTVGAPGCYVFDVRLPGMSGIDVCERIRFEGSRAPVIFMTGYADVATAVRAFKLGAFEFLEKPFSRQVLLETVQRALEEDRARRARQQRWADAESRLGLLSRKERDVLDLVAEGKSNKVIAARFSISERAVEMRRSNMMKKLGVQSLAEVLNLLITTRVAAELRDETPAVTIEPGRPLLRESRNGPTERARTPVLTAVAHRTR